MGGKLKFSDEETDKTESAGKLDPPAGRKSKSKKPVSAKSRNKKVLKTDADTDGSVKPTEPKSKLKLSKDEKSKVKDEKRTLKQDKKISKLEHKTEKYIEKRDKARIKQPTRKKKVKERFYNESKDKTQTKIRFETEPIPISEAKWNKPKKRSLSVKGVAALTTAGVNKVHLKVYEAEHENVGTQAAHRAELVGESAVGGGKRLIHQTYRFAKNTPYRQSAKFETKLIQTNMKLEYEKAVKENPKLKSNKLSQFMQRKKIKRKYADALRKAQKSGETLKKSGSVLTKTAVTVTKIVRRNPIFLLKAGLLLLVVFAVLSTFTMCMGMFSGMTGALSFACYSADDIDIDQAELSYTEWETDLEIEILNAEASYGGYDEYRYAIGSIGHDPYELMAFLTAVYADFTYSDVESVLREIFDSQYTLEFVPETEIRTKTETRTGVYTDDDGNEISYEYQVEVEYEYHILNVTLTSVSFVEIVLSLMTEEQTQHFNILIQTKGGRQYGSSPFDVNWLPHVTSKYGYRVHPITGVKDYHKGIDIAFPQGTEILAGLDGSVTTAAYDGSYGNYVVISDGKGLEMKYAHCDTLLVFAEQPVSKGDVIATVGSTGGSTGPHLHMEILKDGIHINPIYFVETK